MPQCRLILFGSSDHHRMIALRDRILRKPLGLRFTVADLRREVNDRLIGCFTGKDHEENDDNLAGCCILTPIDKTKVQLRQMAVTENMQGQGIGKLLIRFAEEKAREAGFSTIMMHARKTAISFYEKAGYRIVGDEFREVGIPHVEMQKQL